MTLPVSIYFHIFLFATFLHLVGDADTQLYDIIFWLFLNKVSVLATYPFIHLFSKSLFTPYPGERIDVKQNKIRKNVTAVKANKAYTDLLQGLKLITHVKCISL